MDFMMHQALLNWTELNKLIGLFNEEQLKTMLDHELNTKARRTICVRLHQQYGKARNTREREEINNATKADGN